MDRTIKIIFNSNVWKILEETQEMDRSVVLSTLYNQAMPQGMGYLHYDPAAMTVDQARQLLLGGQTYFDYVKGRVMKIDMSKDVLDTALYNRDNGPDAAEIALARVLKKERKT